MGNFAKHTTKTITMKNQNQFMKSMKCHRTNGKFALLIISSIFLFTSCGNGLSREKAEKLIKDYYQFPTVETDKFSTYESFMSAHDVAEKRKILFEKNLIYKESNGNDYYYFTQEGKKYITEEVKRAVSYCMIISGCFVFDKITGITIDEKSHLAKVEYTVKRIGITPFGEYYGYKENEIVKSFFNFEKYDDGWRIQTIKDYKPIKPDNYSFFTKDGQYIENK